MTKLKKLSRAELAQVSGGAYKTMTLQLGSWGRQSAALPPFGGGIPGGPLAEAAFKSCVDHPGACNTIPPSQPRD